MLACRPRLAYGLSMPNHPLELYLAGCASTHATGAATDETAYYPVLKALLDAAGHLMKPRVHCHMGLKNQGAGMPDGGLFTPDQFQRGEKKPRPGQLSLRGVIECKPPKAEVLELADTRQTSTLATGSDRKQMARAQRGLSEQSPEL